MVAQDKDTTAGQGAQAEPSEIERQLLNRELDRRIALVNQGIATIMKAFEDLLPSRFESNKIGEVTGTCIAQAMSMSRGDFEDFGGMSRERLAEALGPDHVERLTSNVVHAFLQRVSEIGEIAEAARG